MKKKLISLIMTVLTLVLVGSLLVGATGIEPVRARPSGWFDITDYGAVASDESDDTAAINRAIEAADANGGGTVYIPAGVYLVDPSVGVSVKKGTTILGDGDDASVLSALPVGGSVIRRDFDPQGPNPYVDNVSIRRIAIVLNHPRITAESGADNYEQIGFDFRHITRSTIEECYVGNYSRGSVEKIQGGDPGCNWREMIQGYGVVLGNTYASSPAYCGGEVNTITRCTIWGVKKAIVLDDLELSPLSAAHATVVDNCDIQICESGIVQESQYTAGCVFRDNIVQAVGKAGYGDNDITSTNPTYFYRLEGYSNTIYGGYIEDQAKTDYVISLGGASRNNQVILGYYQTWNGKIIDQGVNNVLEYFDHITGEYTKLINRQSESAERQVQDPWVKFDRSGVILEGYGVSGVVKNGAGDYTVQWENEFPSADYSVSFAYQVDHQGSAGIVVLQEQKREELRISSYKSTPGKPTQMDMEYIIATTVSHKPADMPPVTMGTSFEKPFGLAVTEEDAVVVCELAGNTVTVVAADGAAKSLGGAGTGASQFTSPFGAAVAPDGSIFIADTMNHRIQKFSAAGRFQRSFGQSGTGDGQLNQPHFLTVNSRGEVLVSDTLNHRISIFDSNGAWIKSINHSNFSYPTGIAVDEQDSIYVLNYGKSELMKFTAQGEYVATFGGEGSGNGEFQSPYGLFYRAGFLFVGDRNNNRVQKLDSQGNWILTIGTQGTGEGQFQEPSGVVVDSKGMIYVADWKNDRVQIFDAQGNFNRFLSKNEDA